MAAYLEALETHRPKRGRNRTPDSIRKNLAEIDAALPAATGTKKLELALRKIDFEAELSAKDVAIDLTDLRKKLRQACRVVQQAEGHQLYGLACGWRQCRRLEGRRHQPEQLDSYGAIICVT